MDRTVTCTLTLIDDKTGAYVDDLQYQDYLGKTVEGPLGCNELTRLVVGLLNRWVDDYGQQCRRDELRVLGRALYAIAFGDALETENAPLRAAFESTLTECRRHGHRLRLRLVLLPGATTLSTYPWEFMYLATPDGSGFFLAGEDTGLSLTRFVPNSDSWQERPDPAEDGRLRILVVVSTPQIPGMTRLRVDDFVDRVLSLDPARFDATVASSPTRKQLKEAIEAHRPHAIHFIGHGRPGFLALTKEAGRISAEREFNEGQRRPGQAPEPVSEADWVDAATASGLLRTGLDDLVAPPPRLIFLHACESDKPEETRSSLEGLGSVARELARADRISGVIAMQYTIGVDDAEIFANCFYAKIADSCPIDEAMAAARKALAEEPRPGRDQFWNDRGFGTPVIYLRREDALVPSRRTPADDGVGGTGDKKEGCPNGRCDGYVMRARQRSCMVCGEPFIPCPRCHIGLVVAKPDSRCNNNSECDYVVPRADAAPDVPGGDASREQASSHSRTAGSEDRFVPQHASSPESRREPPPESTNVW